MNQLIHKTDASCDLSFRYPYGPSRHGEKDYSDIPLVMHSNGTVCWEITDYILHRFNLNPSIARATLGTYARHLSRVVTFLDLNKLTFGDLTDYHIFELVKFLQDSKNSNSGKPADNNQINGILTRLFNLLQFLQSTERTKADFISSDLSEPGQINIALRQHNPTAKRTISYFIHPAKLPFKNTVKRNPIKDEIIDSLICAIYEFTDNKFIQERWCCLLSILENTGARETEVSNLSVASVMRCMKQIKAGDTPRLQLTTNKGSNHGQIREIPISSQIIQEVHEFIITHQAKLASNAVNNNTKKNSYDYVFTTNDGKRKITGKRISDHFREVRDFAKIKKSEASPHLFRHRFITGQVKARLNDFMAEHGSYKTGLESFIIKRVKVLTGHVSDASLWGYVNDAIDNLDIFKNMESKLNSQNNNLVKNRKMTALFSKAKTVTSTKEKAKILDQLLRDCI